MQAGATVVASRIGGLDTFISHGRTGLLVEPGDVAAWADTISSLLASPGWARRLARRGAIAVRSLTVDSHLEALDLAMAGPPPRTDDVTRARTGQ
jgi:glycosyltransferase involved in cell wall biosynthesis